ncbi:MAG: hypothetical protein K6G57_03815 [Lachnospiraceae bacterium]|nr:hypothetical protein [Lachnospiraceae bacterium]
MTDKMSKACKKIAISLIICLLITGCGASGASDGERTRRQQGSASDTGSGGVLSSGLDASSDTSGQQTSPDEKDDGLPIEIICIWTELSK